MSPRLFNMLIADLEEYLRKGGWGRVKLKEEKVYSLTYADDIVTMAEREDNMSTRLENYVRMKGLVINIKKSKRET